MITTVIAKDVALTDLFISRIMLKVRSVADGTNFIYMGYINSYFTLGKMYTAYRQASIAAYTYRVEYWKRSKGVTRIQDKVGISRVTKLQERHQINSKQTDRQINLMMNNVNPP